LRSMSTIISIVSYPFLPAKLGGQKGIALFNKYLSAHVRLICITTKNNIPSAAEGYEVRNTISNSPLRYINIFLFFSIYKTIKKEKASHLILEHPYYGWLGILLKRFSGVKLVMHSHNIEALRWKTLKKWWWPVLAFYEKQTHRYADQNFFIRQEDKLYAIETFGLKAEKCNTITYGIEWNTIPPETEKQGCKRKLQQLHNIAPGTKILLFNGSLDYAPNLQAVKTIAGEINELLITTGEKYKIIICGKGLPAEMNELIAYADKNIIYAGFVEDISIYFKAADIFINPVIDGGGIKTKLVEALGHNVTCVTTESGAVGVPPELNGNKMCIVADTDVQGFVNAILQADINANIPATFFEHFYWGNIAMKVKRIIG
ncbi:MAG: glycosyltransferase family 4 protein, partial [Bacteroidota bacterium]